MNLEDQTVVFAHLCSACTCAYVCLGVCVLRSTAMKCVYAYMSVNVYESVRFSYLSDSGVHKVLSVGLMPMQSNTTCTKCQEGFFILPN